MTIINNDKGYKTMMAWKGEEVHVCDVEGGGGGCVGSVTKKRREKEE